MAKYSLETNKLTSIDQVKDFVGGSDFKFNWKSFDNDKKVQHEESLKIKDNAKRDGLQKLPAIDSKQLSQTESEIESTGVNWFSEMTKLAKSYAQNIEDSISLIKKEINDGIVYKKILTKMGKEHDDATHGHKQQLQKIEKQILKEEDRYKAFKLENEIIREAEPYTSSSLTFAISIVAILLFIEIAVNSTLIGAVAEEGMVEGVVASFGVAFINVFISSLIGYYVLKKINLTDDAIVKSARLFRNVYILFIFYTNLVFASFRQILSSVGDDDEEVIQTTLQLNDVLTPWVVLPYFEFNSYILLLVGVSFAGIAMWDGYKFDDIYPKFGQMKRNVLNKREEKSDLEIQKSKEEEKIFNKAFTDADNIHKVHAENVNLFIQCSQRYQEMVINLKTEVELLQSNIKHMIDEYREKNKYFRGDTPAPRYFDDAYELPLDSDPKSVFKANYDNIFRESDDEIGEESKKLTDTVNEKYTNFTEEWKKSKNTLREAVE